MRFHFPSMLVGLGVAFSLVCFVAAQRAAVGGNGRFGLQATENHVFIIDTDTGRVWQKFVTDGSGQTDQDFSLPKIR